MRPLVVLLGIVMGSAVSIAAALLMTAIVFLLLPGAGDRLQDERGPLMAACAVMMLLAGAAVASFYGEARRRPWRLPAHGALVLMLAITVWMYWPDRG